MGWVCSFLKIHTTIRGCGFSGFGSFGRGGGQNRIWGTRWCGAGFTAPLSFRTDMFRKKKVEARPFEAGWEADMGFHGVGGLGRARATTPHFFISPNNGLSRWCGVM